MNASSVIDVSPWAALMMVVIFLAIFALACYSERHVKQCPLPKEEESSDER
jgi:hypothetical protein